MTVWKLQSDDGLSFTIDAPADVTEAEVKEFAAANADSWANGGRYRMEPESESAAEPAKPQATQRNLEVAAAVQSLNRQIAELEAALKQAQSSEQEYAATEGGAITGLRRKGDVAGIKSQIEDLKRQRDQFQVGSTGQTVGGLGGTLAGAGMGAVAGGLVAGPPGAVVGGVLGSILGGAGGVALGTHLWDIPEARNAIDISDQEAAALVKSRAIESLIWDGAFVLILGPGGRLIGKMARGEKFLPAFKASAKQAVAWDDIVNAQKTQQSKVIESRVQAAPKNLTTEASEALGVPKPGEKATRELIEELSARSGGRVPTTGEMSGVVGNVEAFARRHSPTTFAENDVLLANTAEAIRKGALADLDVAGAYGKVELGEAIPRVVDSATRTLKRETGPVFERAAQQNIFVNMKPVLDYVDDVLKRSEASAIGTVSTSEQQTLTRLRDALREKPMMTPEAAQDLISGLKAKGRDIEGVKPSSFMKKVLTETEGAADTAYLASLQGVDPVLAKELLAARKLYKSTLGDLYSDIMATAADKNPSAMARYLTSGADAIDKIRELRTGLDRAVTGAPAKSRYKGGLAPENLTELGKEAMARERARIDAGLVKGFIEKNTLSLDDLSTKMRDPDFRLTLKELLMGKGAADPKLGQKVLDELDRVMAVMKIAHPETAPTPGRIGVGPFGSVGSGTAAAAATGGSIQGAVGLVTTLFGLTRLIGHAMATSMTTGNTGVFRTIQRAFALAPAAGKNAAAAEALRHALEELDDWSRQTGGPSVFEQAQPAPVPAPQPAPAILGVRG